MCTRGSREHGHIWRRRQDTVDNIMSNVALTVKRRQKERVQCWFSRTTRLSSFPECHSVTSRQRARLKPSGGKDAANAAVKMQQLPPRLGVVGRRFLAYLLTTQRVTLCRQAQIRLATGRTRLAQAPHTCDTQRSYTMVCHKLHINTPHEG